MPRHKPGSNFFPLLGVASRYLLARLPLCRLTLSRLTLSRLTLSRLTRSWPGQRIHVSCVVRCW